MAETIPDRLASLLDMVVWMQGDGPYAVLEGRLGKLPFEQAFDEAKRLSELRDSGFIVYVGKTVELTRDTSGTFVDADGNSFPYVGRVDSVRYPSAVCATEAGKDYRPSLRRSAASKLGWALLTAVLGGLFGAVLGLVVK